MLGCWEMRKVCLREFGLGFSFVAGAFTSHLVAEPYRHAAAAVVYPLGFIFVIMARQELFTENTVVPKGDALSLLFIVWPTSVASKDAVVGQFGRMHPKPHQRQRRLIALGAEPVVVQTPPGVWAGVRATLAPSRWNRMTPLALVLKVLFFVVVPALMAVALVLSAIVLVMLTMLSLMLMMVMMAVAWAVLNFLFLTLPRWIRR